MEELFTFNSQQFQAIDRRPASTDNPPNIRKRIMTSKMNKKSSVQSQASTKEDVVIGCQDKLSPLRKVTFKIDHILQNYGPNNEHILSYPKKTISMPFNQCKTIIDHQPKQDNIQPQSSRKEKKSRLSELGMRSLSTRDKVERQIISKNQEIIDKKLEGIRERRIFSQKLSPKIVLISQRKLPKAFKINFLVDQSLPKIQRKDTIKEDLNNIHLYEGQTRSYQIPKLQGNQKYKQLRKRLNFCQD